MAEHWCKEHKQAFFKKGKMKGFAHPILDDDGEPTGEWCNEPGVEGENGKPKGRSYGKSDKELAQQRQLEEAKRHSIEAQTALNRAVDFALAPSIDVPADIPAIKEIAREFYQLLQSLSSEADVSVATKKPVRPGLITQPVQAPVDVVSEPNKEPLQEQAGEQIPQTVAELMKWVISHGKTYTPSWACKLLNVKAPTEIQDIEGAYKELKVKGGW